MVFIYVYLKSCLLVESTEYRHVIFHPKQQALTPIVTKTINGQIIKLKKMLAALTIHGPLAVSLPNYLDSN